MKTKIILEFSYCHNGIFEIAKEMIDEAKKLKVFGIKFQKWDIEGLPDWKKQEKRKDKNAFGKTYYEHRKKLEFNIEQLLELKKYTELKGLKFICSGKDYNSIIELVENGIKWIKLPSQRYGDNDIFKYLITRKPLGIKIIVSTGMKYENEILNSKWIKYADVIMHCISKYPAKLEDCNFAFMRKHNFYNGYSSHETKGLGILPAIFCGAEYIERHYTLDKTAKGSDHIISSDYKEIRKIIKDIELYECAIGDGNRNITNEELRIRNIYTKF